MFEMLSLIELLGIGLMASLDLTVHLRAARRYVFVGNAEVGKMSGELWSERRTVIGLDSLNGEGEVLPDRVQQKSGRKSDRDGKKGQFCRVTKPGPRSLT